MVLTVEDDEFYRVYYAPFYSLHPVNPTVRLRLVIFRDRDYSLFFLPGTDVAIGLDNMVLQTLNGDGNWTETIVCCTALPPPQHDGRMTTVPITRRGLLV